MKNAYQFYRTGRKVTLRVMALPEREKVITDRFIITTDIMSVIQDGPQLTPRSILLALGQGMLVLPTTSTAKRYLVTMRNLLETIYNEKAQP